MEWAVRVAWQWKRAPKQAGITKVRTCLVRNVKKRETETKNEEWDRRSWTSGNIEFNSRFPRRKIKLYFAPKDERWHYYWISQETLVLFLGTSQPMSSSTRGHPSHTTYHPPRPHTPHFGPSSIICHYFPAPAHLLYLRRRNYAEQLC